jgi:hypothetical protein
MLAVHECPPDIYRLPPQERFRRFGYENHVQRFWDTNDEDYVQHVQCQGNFSGHTTVLFDGQENRPVIFVMRPTEFESDDCTYGWMMGILFHELGHVDDITRGLNIGFDRLVNMGAAEEYAHHFACDRIIREAALLGSYLVELAPGLPPSQRPKWRELVTEYYRVIMAFYICEILRKYAALPYPSVSEAAQRVLRSEPMSNYRRFAGSAASQWTE